MLFFSFGCNKIIEDDELSLQRRNYTGNELRTDGYYYYYHNDGVNPERIVVFFLNRNGIIKTCGSPASIQDFESRTNPCPSNSFKIGWGVFIVEKDIIKYEMWRGARALEPCPVIMHEGKILNDTSFHITSSYRSNGSERYTENNIYHFRQFSPKPDSTNSFIK